MVDFTKDYTPIIREGMNRACKEFSEAVLPGGFKKTRSRVWTRQRTHAIEFIHFFRSGSSYGKASTGSVRIRVHWGIRVLNSGLDFMHLNGPSSGDGQLFGLRFHLRFNAETGSTYERCMADLSRLVEEHIEPWFQKFSDPLVLFSDPSSPLNAEEKDALEAALYGQPDPARIAASLKLMGIKKHVPLLPASSATAIPNEEQTTIPPGEAP
ncbi:hypothetical protein CDL60_19810 [Roseateles noduli]|nr:hypothetical protein CDL60_19810 [Roseateles noduli]